MNKSILKKHKSVSHKIFNFEKGQGLASFLTFAHVHNFYETIKIQKWTFQLYTWILYCHNSVSEIWNHVPSTSFFILLSKQKYICKKLFCKMRSSGRECPLS